MALRHKTTEPRSSLWNNDHFLNGGGSVIATGHNNDLDIEDNSYFSWSGDASYNVTGIDDDGVVAGDFVVFRNADGTDTVTLTHNDAASAVGHRFLCPGAADFALAPGEAVLIIYDGANWVVMGMDQANLSGDLLPATTQTYDLGSAALEFAEVHTQEVFADGIAFPATQVPDADANTLDDYEEGTWTPTVTFTTPGDLSVTYSTQDGHYDKIGRQVTIRWRVTTSTFTHTTAGGTFRLAGLPFALGTGNQSGPTAFRGDQNEHQTIVARSVAGSQADFIAVDPADGTAALAALTSSDVPTGITVDIIGSLTYTV